MTNCEGSHSPGVYMIVPGNRKRRAAMRQRMQFCQHMPPTCCHGPAAGASGAAACAAAGIPKPRGLAPSPVPPPALPLSCAAALSLNVLPTATVSLAAGARCRCWAFPKCTLLSLCCCGVAASRSSVSSSLKTSDWLLALSNLCGCS